MPFRLLMCIVFSLCVWWAHYVRSPGEEDFPTYFYLILLLFYALHQVISYRVYKKGCLIFTLHVREDEYGGFLVDNTNREL